jgi:hypothetical protein
MAEQHLDHANVHVLLKQMGGKAMPECMRRHAFVDSGLGGCLVHGAIELACTQRLDRIAAGEQPQLRPLDQPPVAQVSTGTEVSSKVGI